MTPYKQFLRISTSTLILFFFLFSCKNSNSKHSSENTIVTNPSDMNSVSSDFIETYLENAKNNHLNDSDKIYYLPFIQDYYSKHDYKLIWSKKAKWNSIADTLFNFLTNAEKYGLFPNDYHFKNLQYWKTSMDNDPQKQMNASLWAKCDVLLTDGLLHIFKDLKQGRLQHDSISLNKDSALNQNFYTETFSKILEKNNFANTIKSLQPRHKGYWDLLAAIPSFLDSMDRKSYTYVTFPYKKNDVKDSLFFIKILQKRLVESNCLEAINKFPDSLSLIAGIKKYQIKKGLKADGKLSSSLVKIMNTNDLERLNFIAITLDKYKQLPDTMPSQYIWVNLPGYYLWVINHDTIALESKTICGKPDTRTPQLTSEISDMVTYPTWTVPNSIILKNYLPKLKNNPNYINRIGLKLMTGSGKIINGNNVNWDKYNKGIPYRIVQNSGDRNSLGVMKFNFKNSYSVYLHDTNQRYLFKNGKRDLSHGCVRVQEWQKLAFYIARNDSMDLSINDSLKVSVDSIKSLLASKKNKVIKVNKHIPLFIRYFTCEGKNGKVKFYDDIYGDDKILREKYLSK